MLWSDRRFNHLLCPLVVNADTINNISHHFDVDANSFNIWLNSLKDMPSASLGFVQKLIISDSITPQVGSRNPQKLNYKVTPEEVDATASTLSSTVRNILIFSVMSYDCVFFNFFIVILFTAGSLG